MSKISEEWWAINFSHSVLRICGINVCYCSLPDGDISKWTSELVGAVQGSKNPGNPVTVTTR